MQVPLSGVDCLAVAFALLVALPFVLRRAMALVVANAATVGAFLALSLFQTSAAAGPNPNPPTGVIATDGVAHDYVDINFVAPNQTGTSNCTSIYYDVMRNGSLIATLNSEPLTGNPLAGFRDNSVALGTSYTYSVTARCFPSGNARAGNSDTGYASSPLPVPSVTASDGAFPDRVQVTFLAPNQSTGCSAVSYQILRGGNPVGTVNTVPVGGGSGSFDDMSPPAGSHLYSIRTVCTPGGAFPGYGTPLSTVNDSGYASAAPAVQPASSVAASDGTFNDRVRITFTAPNQSAACTAVSYRILRDGGEIGVHTGVSLTGVVGVIWDDVTVDDQQHSYSVDSLCSPSGTTATSSTDVGLKAAGGPPVRVSVVSATKGTYADRVDVSYTMPNQSGTNCTVAPTYAILRDSVQIATQPGTALGGPSTYVDTAVTPGVWYMYQIAVECGGSQNPVSLQPVGGYAGAPPPPPEPVVTFSVSQGTLADRIAIDFESPGQALNFSCTSVDYELYRDGTTLIATFADSPVGGQFFSFWDYVIGYHSYHITTRCVSGATVNSSTRWGWTQNEEPPALPPANFSASDGTFSDRVRITYTMVDQAGTGCPLEGFLPTYRIRRNGVPIQSYSNQPMAGSATPVVYDDLTASPGVSYSYDVLIDCGGSVTAQTATDAGHAGTLLGGTPAVVTAVSASDGTFADRIRVTFTAPDQSSVCSSVSYVITQDGVDVGTVGTIAVTGGSGSFDHMTGAIYGTYQYRVRSVCSPGGATALSASDLGWTSASVSTTASASGEAGGVRVTWGALVNPGLCDPSEYYIGVTRQRDSATVYSSVYMGAASHLDTGALPGVPETYTFVLYASPISACNGNTFTAYVTATRGAAAVSAVSAVAASDGSFADRVRVTFTAPDQSAACTSVNYVVVRDAVDLTTISTIPVTGGAGSFDDMTATPGSHTYSVRSVCSPGGATAASGSDTGYKQSTPLAATAVAASDGTFSTKIAISFIAPDQSAQCTSVNYVVIRDAADLTTITTIPVTGGAGAFDDTTATAGPHTYSVRTVCTPGGATAVSANDSGFKQGTPLAVTAVAASDATFIDRVRITFTAPDQTGRCVAPTYYVVRDGVDLTNISTIPLTGGSGSYDDTTAAINASYTYSIRTNCTFEGVSATSASDVGYRASLPMTISGVAASDGTFSDRIQVTFTAPNQSIVCSDVDYVIVRDGADQATITTTPVTGGPVSYDDMTASSGSHSYVVRAVCLPSGGTANSLADTGYKQAAPLAATAVAASDGAFTTKVAITFTAPDQSAQCTSADYVVVRDGGDVGTITTIPVTGGAGAFDDTTVGSGTHTYAVRSVCSPGGATASSSSDTGFKQGTPLAATAVSASDGTFPAKVAISFTAPDQSAQCTSVDYVVVRDAGDLTTITTIPVTGGAGAFDDTTVGSGTHTYSVRSVCTPGGATATSGSDTGYKQGTPLAATAVAASDGTYGTAVMIDFVAPDQSGACTSVSYVLIRDGTPQLTNTTVPLTGGAANFQDIGVAAGLHTYAVQAVCTPGGATATSASDTGYKRANPSGVTGVAASDGLFSDKIQVTFTAPNQSFNCDSVEYVIMRDGASVGSVTTVPVTGGPASFDDLTATPGNHSYWVNAVCSPGATTAGSSADTGYKQGTPLAATAVSATDGTFPAKVVVTFTAPNQSAQCPTADYIVVRDGGDVGTITTIPVTGGAGAFDDTAVSIGPHTYSVRTVCSPGGATASSSSDTGYKQGTALAATAVAASDGTFPAKVAITFTAPDQSAQCTSADYVVVRDGGDVATITTIPVTGGAGAFDDTTVGSGTHTYSVRTVCAPGGSTAASTSDTGYKQGTPLAATAVAASDGAFPTKIAISFTAPDQSAVCASADYVLVRDGADLTTITTIPLTGGAGAFDDTTVGSGTHTYSVRTVCSPGGATALSASDTGFKQGVPLAATAVAASDGTFPAKVAISFTAPDQTAVCTGVEYVLVRDGADLTTITTIPLTGGAGAFDDTTAAAGSHTYSVRSVCTPGGATSASASDTGYKQGTPLAATTVTASDGTFSDRVQISFTAPDQSLQCASSSYVVTRDAVDLTTISTIPLTGGPGSYDDLAAAPGSHVYGVRTVCAPGNTTVDSATDTGFKAGLPVAATAVAASDGTFATKVAVVFTAPNQSLACASTNYVIVRDGADVATISTIPVTGGPGSFDDNGVSPGTHTYAVRAECLPGGATVPSTTDTGYRGGTPLAVTTVSASDGTFPTKVSVSFTAPDQSAECALITYEVRRDGVAIDTVSSIPLAGGAGLYDDTGAPAGTHSYVIRSICSPGGGTADSTADSGHKSGTPFAATAVAASDGTFTTKVAVSFTAPDQSAVCTSVDYVLVRDGGDLTTITTIPLTGGAGAFDDLTVGVGTHTYSVRSVCSPGATTAASSSDTGFKQGTPLAATSVAASDGAFTTKVAITFTAPDQSAQCTSADYVVVRNGGDVVTITTIPVTGGAGAFDDTTVGSGTHTYSVRTVCAPGGATAASASDTGFKQGTPLAATAVVASDGTFPAKVAINFTAPDQSAQCTSVDYVVVRDAGDLTTITTIPVTGGAGAFDDTTATAGLHTYSVRSVCTPGGATAASTSDTGYKQGTPLAATAVAASDGAFPTKIAVTFTAPDQSAQCSSTDYIVVRDGGDVGTISTIPLTGGAGAFDDTTVGSGTHTYSVRAVCTPGGATASSSSDTGYKQGTPLAATAVVASDGTFPAKVAITFNAPDQSAACTSVDYIVVRNGTDVGTITTVPLAGGPGAFDDTSVASGTHSYLIRSVCTPGGVTATSTSDTGYKQGAPLPATAVTASDGTFTTKVAITFTAPDQASQCAATDYIVVRDGGDVGTISTIPVTGGAGAFDDTTVGTGTHTYSVRSVCAPGGATAASASDSGFKQGTPLAATAVTASDGTFPAKVVISFTAPDQSAVCTSADYVLVRDGGDLTTITTIPVTGGAGAFDDLTVGSGTHTYSVRSVCSPGGATAASASDTGYKQGTPLAVTGVAATDGTFTTKVTVSFTAPDQSAQCTSSEYTVVRDGADVGTITTIPLTGGAGAFDDLTAPIGVRTYAIRTVCTPGGGTSTSATDTGFRQGAPLAATALSATDGVYSDRVRITFTAPDQASQCVSATYTIVRDGSDVSTISTIALTGAAASYDDMAAPSGSLSYAVRTDCAPGGTSAVSLTDTGFKAGTPLAVTAVAATDGAFPNKVVVTFTAPDQSASCSAVQYSVTRNGSDVATLSTVPLAGGPGSYDDLTPAVGLQTYAVRSICSPGGVTATSSSDTGFRLGTPSVATAVAASDGAFPNKVVVTFTAPDQSGQCTSVAYVILRDGSNAGTVSTLPVTGGAGTFDDTTASAGSHTYAVQAECTPGSATALSAADTGFILVTPLAATALAATDGTFPSQVTVTFTAPDQSALCSSVQYILTRDAADLATISTVPVTGGPGSFDDTTVTPGTHTYGVRTVCTPGGGTATSSTDTGYKLGTPLAPTAVSATDGTYSNRVRVTFTAPDQSAQCSAIDYIVVRGGSDVGSVTVALAGGAGAYDDMGVPAGVQTYSVRAVCTPGNQTALGSTDTGYKTAVPQPVTGVAASDGTDPAKVVVTFTAPDQTASCSSTDYVVVRDLVDLATLSTVPVTGGPGTYDDTTATSGIHSYSVRAVCTPGNATADSSTDTGYRSGTPSAPTGLSATDGTSSTKVTISFTAPNQSSQCSAINYVVVRNGADAATLSTIPLTGGPASYDDTGVAPGVHSYEVRAVCTPGNTTALSTSDTGFRLGTPLAPTAVAASDGTFATKVAVAFTAPDQSGECSSVVYTIARDAADVATISSIPLTGGPGTYDDTTVSSGSHTYTVRAVCTPGSQAATSASDTGYKLGAPLAATSVTASDGLFTDKVQVTWTAPDQSAQCTSVQYVVTREGVDVGTIPTIPLAGGPGTFDDSTVPSGTFTYGVRAVCTPGNQVTLSATDTGFKTQACDPVTLSGPQGTGPLPATITWNTATGATQYEIAESLTLGGPYTALGTVPSGTTSYSIAGWPKKYLRVTCVASTPIGNAVSPGVQVWGNPPPTVTGQTFDAPAGTMTSITPVVTDPDGNTTFTLAVTVPPANGSVVINGGRFEYTPNVGYEGNDSFTLSATDPQGGVGTAVFTANVVSSPPAMPANVRATDGTRLDDVQVTWNAAQYATSYDVYMGTSAADSSPTLVGNVLAPQLSFDHTGAATGQVRWYSVQAKNGAVPGPRSAADSGFRDTAPTNLSAAGTTLYTAQVDMAPSVTDPDPGEVFVFTVETQPAQGTASFVAGKFRYVPNGTFLGQDTFTIKATDRANASVTGTATVDVGCLEHNATSITLAPVRAVVNGTYRARLTYNTYDCPATYTATINVLSGATVVDTQTQASLPTGQDLPLNFDMVAPATAGSYGVQIRLTNNLTGQEILRTGSLVVEAFRMPPVAWKDTTTLAGIETVTLSMGTGTQCTITTDDAAARADSSLCVVTAEQLPAEVALTGASTPTWSGVPATAANYPVIVRVSQYDAGGTSHELGSASVPLTVVLPSNIVYQSPPNITAKQALEVYKVTPTQQSGLTCALYADVAAAVTAIAGGKRACYLTWTSTATGTDYLANGREISGAVFDTTPVTNVWTLNLVKADSSLSPIGTGSTVVTPTPLSMSFNLVPSPSDPIAMVTNVTLSVAQTGTDKCAALTPRDSTSSTSTARPCLFEFGAVAGMAVDGVSTTPLFKGKLPSSPTTIQYTVSIYFKGTKHEIATGQQDIVTAPPVSPVINFEYVRQIAPDVYAVSTLGGSMGVISADTSRGELAGTFQVQGAPGPTPFVLYGSKRRQVVMVGPAPLYSTRTLDVTLGYQSVPAVSSSRTVTLVSVPRDGLRLELLSPPVSAPDTMPVTVSAGIRELTTTGLQYIAANAGQWQVVFGEITANGSFVPISAPITTDSNGAATTSLDLAGRTFLRLAAQATPVGGGSGYTVTLRSRMSLITVSKGTPIEGSITSVGPTEGPAPYLTTLRVMFTTRADQIANQSVTWYQSSDGGVTWETPAAAVGLQFSPRLAVGDYLFRVKFVNVNTGDESYSPNLALKAYPVPKVMLSGPTYLLPGTPGEMVGTATYADGSPMPNVVWSWELQRRVLGSPTITLTSGTTMPIPVDPVESGVYRLVVKARAPGTNASDTRAWSTALVQIISGIPGKPVVRISGPLRLETGKTGSFVASAVTTFDLTKSNLTIDGAWTLPNGSTVPGKTLEWTPTTADFALSRTPTLSYTAWITGYENDTRSTAIITPTLWQYVWPTWKVTKGLGSTYAPAGVQLVVTATDMTLLPVLEGLTYQWTVPNTIRITNSPTSKLTGIIDYGGSHDVQVTVSDARGNTQQLTESVMVDNPPPLTVETTIVNLNKWSHAPMNLALSVKTTGGHPLDGVNSWTYFVNGVQQDVPNQYYARLALDAPGTYEVEARVGTRMGATASKLATVVVPANAPPTCGITGTIALNRRSVAVKGNCVDSDGTLVNYKWFINGEPASVLAAGAWTYMLPTGVDLPVSIQVIVTDNGGLTGTSTVTFQ